MPLIITDEVWCFVCHKTGEEKSSSNVTKFKLMVKLHTKTCDECVYSGKLLKDKCKKGVQTTTTKSRYGAMDRIKLTAEDLRIKVLEKTE